MSEPVQRRVLVFYPFFPPDATAGAFRVLRWAKYLPEAGWWPRFVAMRHSQPRIRRDSTLAQELPEGIDVERVASWAPEERIDTFLQFLKRSVGRESSRTASSLLPTRSPGRSTLPERPMDGWRSLWALMFRTPDRHIWWSIPALWTGWKASKRSEFDAILTTGPPHSVHWIGMLLQRWTRRPWICDFRDPWAVASFGQDFNPRGQRVRRRLEARVFQTADRVVLNTPRAVTFYRDRYPSQRAKLSAITNGFDPTYLRWAQPATEVAKAGAQLARPLRICHPGSLYGQRDPSAFLRALAKLRDDHGLRLSFEQIGRCDPRLNLEGLVADLELQEQVELRPPASHAEVLRRLKAADLFLILQPNAPLQVPSKLYEMMLFAKPILALTGEGATADLMQSRELGITEPADDVERIGKALRQLIDWTPRIPVGPTGLGECFDGRSLSLEMADLLDQVSNADRP